MENMQFRIDRAISSIVGLFSVSLTVTQDQLAIRKRGRVVSEQTLPQNTNSNAKHNWKDLRKAFTNV